MLRQAAHGGDIRHGAGKRLATDSFRFSFPGKVQRFHHHIGLEEGIPLGIACHYGTVIPRPGEEFLIGGQEREQAGQGGIFAQFGKRSTHMGSISGKRRITRLLHALNTVWMAIGSQRDRAFS